MDKSERQFLFGEKIAEGKGEFKANQEIKSLQDHEKAFRILFREKKQLELITSKLEKENKTLKEKIFKLNFNKQTKPEEPRELNGSIGHLKRILRFMEAGKRYTRSSLGKDLMIPTPEVKELMKFIIDNKIMNVSFDGLVYKKL